MNRMKNLAIVAFAGAACVLAGMGIERNHDSFADFKEAVLSSVQAMAATRGNNNKDKTGGQGEIESNTQPGGFESAGSSCKGCSSGKPSKKAESDDPSRICEVTAKIDEFVFDSTGNPVPNMVPGTLTINGVSIPVNINAGLDNSLKNDTAFIQGAASENPRACADAAAKKLGAAIIMPVPQNSAAVPAAVVAPIKQTGKNNGRVTDPVVTPSPQIVCEVEVNKDTLTATFGKQKHDVQLETDKFHKKILRIKHTKNAEHCAAFSANYLTATP